MIDKMLLAGSTELMILKLLEDYRGNSLLVFTSYWAIDFTIRRNPGLALSETLAAAEPEE